MKRLCELADSLRASATVYEKLEVLNKEALVAAFLEGASSLRTFLAGLSSDCELVIKSLIALGQAERLLSLVETDEMRALLEELLPVERFYREIGGLVGYHVLLMQQLDKKPVEKTCVDMAYRRPDGVGLFELNSEVKRYVYAGIASLPYLAEVYPVGGAADRLRLQDPHTKTPLPAARLQFCGKTLLEWMIQDLQAREYLYFKLFHEQIFVPVAMMTSQEKDNHAQILSLCEEKNWFHRPASHFAFFCQPVVPTVDKEGNWCWLKSCKPLMKPGGHGVIWKLAKDQGIIDWLLSLNRKKMLVRQINNPIAGCDYGLLGFTGVGFKGDKVFGFASCLREVKAAEGINVLIESQKNEGKQYCLTNIEYCDFEKYGIDDAPEDPQSCYSQFPSNTNILFADIAGISRVVSDCPIPGMIVNLKKMTYVDEEGVVQEKELARLESTMQNIADCFIDEFSSDECNHQIPELKTFLTYNHRHKTISTVKREWVDSLLETPEGCYWDLYRNHQDLLENFCGFVLPLLPDLNTYLSSGPCFDFAYHPSLGPLFAVIAQKLRGGSIADQSQLHLELSELDCENLVLNGRLSIRATPPMGHFNEQGKLEYSHQSGRCRLINVQVVNDAALSKNLAACWKREASSGGCEIILHGDCEFEARGVTFLGDIKIEVEEGFRVVAVEKNKEIVLQKQKLSGSSWYWDYTTGSDDAIVLSLAKREAQ